jgi:signal transduction histidine kinase
VTGGNDNAVIGWMRRRRWTLDLEPMPEWLIWAVRAFGFVCIGLATFYAQAHTHDREDLTLQIVGYAVIGGAMLTWALLDARTPEGRPRDSWLPWLLGIIAAVSGVLCMSHNGGLIVLLACIAALVAGGDTAFGTALAVAGAGILGVMVGAIAFGTNVAELIGYPVTILSGLFIGRHRHAYRVQAEQAAELLARTSQLQVQQRRADVLDERTRIAREIHDVLAHSLGGLGIQIQAARAVLTDTGDIDKALEVLGNAQRMASDGLVETRRAVHALRTDALALDDELRNLAATHGSQHRTTVDFAVDGTPRELPPVATMALLRVAQEAFVNAAKHAAYQPIMLRVAYAPDAVRLTVSNPVATAANGSDPELATVDSGYGLTGMRERLLLIGGTLDVGRHGRQHDGPHGGQDLDVWTVDAEVPLERG